MSRLPFPEKEDRSSLALTHIYLDNRLDTWINQQAKSLKCCPELLLKHYLVQGIIVEAQQDTSSPRKYANVLTRIDGKKARHVLKKLNRIIQNRSLCLLKLD